VIAPILQRAAHTVVGRLSEFASPDHQRAFEQSSPLQILEQQQVEIAGLLLSN